MLKQAADESYRDIYPHVTELRGTGLSLRHIAAERNAMDDTTRLDDPWNPIQVKHVLQRSATTGIAAV